MCEACERKFAELSGNVAAAKASWFCEQCKDVTFDKGIDPPDPPEAPLQLLQTTFWDAVTTVAFYAAIVLCGAIVCGVFNGAFK